MRKGGEAEGRRLARKMAADGIATGVLAALGVDYEKARKGVELIVGVEKR